MRPQVLKLDIPKGEWWDDENERFVMTNPCVLNMEHSLISIYRWESKYKRAFLNEKDQKTKDELIDYFRMMTISKPASDKVYELISENAELISKISEYLEDTMTATTFAINDAGDSYNPKKTIITAEIIYYWMVTFSIPFECEKWHLNKLFTLIRVCAIKNQPPNQNKMPKSELYARNRELNAKRKAEFNTRG